MEALLEISNWIPVLWVVLISTIIFILFLFRYKSQEEPLKDLGMLTTDQRVETIVIEGDKGDKEEHNVTQSTWEGIINGDKQVWIGLIIAILVTALTLFIGFKVMKDVSNYNQMNATADCCCNGNYCSDTYYDFKNNTCHLSMCDNIPYKINTSQCTYQGNCSKNWTLQAINAMASVEGI